MRKLIVTLGLIAVIETPAVAANPAEKDVLAAMDVWKQAMLKKDRSIFEKVLHPDLTFGHSSGLVETKAQAIQHVLGSAATWEGIDFADTKVRVNGNTALVTGKVDYHQREKDKVQVINLVVLSVWVKGPQGWQMIARQATRPTPPAAPHN